jgi:hypothetical protein
VMDRQARTVLLGCLCFVFAGIFGYCVGYRLAAEKYKKELDWWMHEPMVRVMDMNFTLTSDLDIWKMNHVGVKVIKLVEMPQKQHYGVYWLPAEEETDGK